MLLSLHIENMAVISTLDVDFGAGLSVLTGETGSGKSVVVDSILFLLGGKPTRDLLRHGAESGLVSAVFSDVGAECRSYLSEAGIAEEDEIMLQRSINKDGKTKCRLNGRVIPQSMLRELSRFLVSVHGQLDNQLLLQQAAEEKILDTLSQFGDDMDIYRNAYVRRNKVIAALDTLKKDAAEAARLKDILKFQINEIDSAKLKDGEEEALLLKRAKLQNAEKISKQSAFAYHVLYGSEKASASLILERASLALSQIAAVIPEADTAAGKLMEMRYEVEDIAVTARDYAEGTEGDPTVALNAVEARLDLITKLRRKYGADIKEVLAFRADAAKRLSSLENSDEERETLEREMASLEKTMTVSAEALHEARCKAAAALGTAVGKELLFLDMPAVRFEIQVERTKQFLPYGCDSAVFAIATNKGEPLLPLSRIASGGELSRVMLALKSVLNRRDGVGTAVFDEVDTGISGKTSRKIGIKLAEIGRHTQVFSVTHSAQIASLATHHYKISKGEAEGRAVSSIKQLNEEERVLEIGRILGGLSVTKAQLSAAAEMIEEGKRYR